MNKRFVAYLLLSFMVGLIACSDDEDETYGVIKGGETYVWKAHPLGIIGNRNATLYWSAPFEAAVPLGITRLDPAYFDVYQSDKYDGNYRKIAKVQYKKDTSLEYTVSDLKNGIPHYFYIVSRYKKKESVYSDTIMLVSNPKPRSEEHEFEGASNVCAVSIRPGQDKVAYMSHFYEWWDGENRRNDIALFISDPDGGGRQLIRLDAVTPQWSPDGKWLAFSIASEGRSFQEEYPSRIFLYDYETGDIQGITGEKDFSQYPVFSRDGKRMLYQSRLYDSSYDRTVIRLKDLSNEQDLILIDPLEYGFTDAEKPYWKDENSFYFGGKVQSDYIHSSEIYEFSLMDNTLKPVFPVLYWKDGEPSVSQDGKHLVFSSNRSGAKTILWLYTFATGAYRMLTGYSYNDYIGSTCQVVGWIDNTTIFYTKGYGKGYVTLSIQ